MLEAWGLCERGDGVYGAVTFDFIRIFDWYFIFVSIDCHRLSLPRCIIAVCRSFI